MISKTKYEIAHEWLLENGPSTVEQIISGLGLTFSRIGQTLYELEKKGWVKKSDQKGKTSKGRSATIYEAIPKTAISTRIKPKSNTVSGECQVYDLPVIETPPRCQHILDLVKECTPRELSFLRIYFRHYGEI